ncbi:BamA/TamA family outer membrane protein, partial [bacterium]|nr:BamA/TamA family outer membrane protein [bacterium]
SIDGGVAENVPVHAARELGDYVIAVDIAMPPTIGDPPYEPWVIVNQVTGLLQKEKNQMLLEAADFVLKPLPDSLSNLALPNPQNYIDLGYQATLDEIDRIKSSYEAFTQAWYDDTVEVAAISFQGYQDSSNNIRNTRIVELLSRGEPVRRQDIADEIKALQGFYNSAQSIGYLSHDTLFFQCHSDQPIHSLKIAGTRQLKADSLVILVKGEATLTRSNLNLEPILRAYRRIGNPLARIDSVIFQDDLATVYINEGRVKAVQVVGLAQVSRGRVLRDFDISMSEPLQLYQVYQGMDELYGSGLFELVRTTIMQDTLTLNVQEHPTPRLRIGAGFDLERHGRAFTELSYEALPYVGGSVTGWLKYAEFDEHYEINYRNLALFRTYLEGSAALFSTRTNYNYSNIKGEKLDSYYFVKIGGSAYLGQQFRTWGRVIAGVQLYRLRHVMQTQEDQFDIQKFYFRSEFDTHDRLVFPTTGQSYTFQVESATDKLGGGVAFSRASLDMKKVIPLTHRFTITGEFNGGICDQAAPYPEWYRIGGEETFYGLHYNEIAGRQLAAFSLELREDLISRFLADAYISVRGDFAAIWEDIEAEVETDNIKRGVGISLALDTFLGPMSLSYGYLLEYKNQPDRNVFYFNLGHHF